MHSIARVVPLMPFCNAGFNAHKKPLPSARMTLDEISHESSPSRWLEEAADQPKPAQQLGTLGGGNHFMEVAKFLANPVFVSTIFSQPCSDVHLP